MSVFQQVACGQCPERCLYHRGGSLFYGDWVYSCLPLDFPLYAALHITYKEAFSIYLAARHWGPAWANHHIIIHSDNQAAVAMTNKGCTRNPLAMSLLFWISATFIFRITAKYIPGINNHSPDAISRLHETKR